MSGFPPIQIFLLCVTFALLAIPLTHLTEGRDAKDTGKGGAATARRSPDASVPAFLRLRYAHRPLTVSLKQGDTELLGRVDLAASPTEARVRLLLTKKIAELSLRATWPDGTPDTALTVELEPEGVESRSVTSWSAQAQLNEVITFQW